MPAIYREKIGLGLEAIALPEPKLEGGMPLAEAFRGRRTSREFSDETAPIADLRRPSLGGLRRHPPGQALRGLRPDRGLGEHLPGGGGLRAHARRRVPLRSGP